MSSSVFNFMMVLKSLWAVLALAVMAVPNLIILLVAALYCVATRGIIEVEAKQPGKTQKQLCVLISGGKMTKAVELCRAFKAHGHRVILIETSDYWFSAGRFSCAVDRFELVPEHKREGQQAYVDHIMRIIKEEQVDVFVPVAHTVDVHADATIKAEAPPSCFVWCETSKVCSVLDDKFQFQEAVRSLGMPTAEQYHVSSNEDVFNLQKTCNKSKKFILKAIGSDPINRTKFITHGPIPFDDASLRAYLESYELSSDNPHVVMEHLSGREYSTSGIFLNGQVLAHTVSETCAEQLHFKHTDHPAIDEWVKTLAGQMQLTGSMSFDLMVVDDVVYPLECNPRVHTTIVNFYEEPDVLVNAYLSPVCKEAAKEAANAVRNSCISPKRGTKQSQWFAGELTYAFLALQRGDLEASKTHMISFLSSREATFRWWDPLPFFWTYHVQMPLLFLWALYQRKPYARIDYLVGKLHWAH